MSLRFRLARGYSVIPSEARNLLLADTQLKQQQIPQADKTTSAFGMTGRWLEHES
jgi:hypothetical protein